LIVDVSATLKHHWTNYIFWNKLFIKIDHPGAIRYTADK